MTQVLMLSVGNSPQPLRRAMESRPWDRVVFVVSDGSGGSQSSRSQVEAAEIDYDRKHGLRGPGLRHVPACPADFGIIEVPPDDLDRALATIDSALDAELAQDRQVTVDYTGGTKTMTAALVLAGSAHEGVAIQFMAGERPDLQQVNPGTERPVEMPGHLLGLANLFRLARAQVARRAYGSALAIMDDVDRVFREAHWQGLAKPPKAWRARAENWRGFLVVLDAWDRFDVAAAWKRLEKGLNDGASWAEALDRSGQAARLAALAGERGQGAGPALCEDLWLNAQRRAELGLYDDAIARLYRLAEAAVQARLHIRHGIADTGCVPRELVPDHIAQGCDRRHDWQSGREGLVLPLYRALALLAHRDPSDALIAVWPRQGERFETPDWQGARNRSILAHGFRPASREDWEAARDWFDARRGPFWEDLLGRPTAPQLPDRLP